MNDRHSEMLLLESITEAALKSAHRVRRKIKGAIDWADLSVAEVEWVEPLHDDPYWRVIIEEADPTNPDFCLWMQAKILKMSGKTVCIATEW